MRKKKENSKTHVPMSELPFLCSFTDLFLCAFYGFVVVRCVTLSFADAVLFLLCDF